MKIRRGPHLSFCQESRLVHAAGKRKKSRFLLYTAHFHSYLKRFNLASASNCPCGSTNGNPLHFATGCSRTTSFHVTKPSQQHELIWFHNVASNKGSRLNDFQELFRINP
ncbi:hypothetical protein AVEN_8846-1 [Araneus ventricosus]|uniref:Uncharacterized protein n=1 Tax=Araneus ventricosus TaxID=182803 RepID=A0A4Y2SFA0_ARAVE|nr:hypothetical protein AVEN_8846-1 [Araneus ventricosus]